MGADLLNALGTLLDPKVLLILLTSVPLGIIVGVLPGIGATVGVTVLLPLTFGMEPILGISMLVAVYCGAFYGGAVSAILINTPGTPAAICTVLDGFPMAQKGEAHQALSMAVVASFLGGLFSVFVLSFSAPLIAEAALRFSYCEYFAIAVFGIIMVITSSSRKSFLKGLIMGTLGLFLSCIGQDKMGTVNRYTFGILELTRGVPLLPVLVGLFAVSQALILTEQGAKKASLLRIAGKTGLLSTFREAFRHKLTLLKSSLIGTIVGAIPGTGAAIASFVSYSEAKRSSKNPEKFGTGEIEGVIASESSNNAVTGGALIPLLTLGIPGDPITAIMLGAFLVHGLIPGPSLFVESAPLVYGIFITMVATYFLVLAFGYFVAGPFAAILKLREAILVPIILVVCFVGAYALDSSLFDVGLALIFGVLGYFLIKLGFPLAPIVMGLILGPIAEEGLRQSLMVSGGSWAIFLTRPIAAVFLGLTVLIVLHKAWVLLFEKKG
ncbi:MAG: C4-dicarboxylate ABC transporter permease [Desulfarculus sp.]|jgi:putative tricarboxylic transport membrane protein|nr:MAG: C4-dicarboxylate ABC transporter permease [Desulfarculus sp.]